LFDGDLHVTAIFNKVQTVVTNVKMGVWLVRNESLKSGTRTCFQNYWAFGPFPSFVFEKLENNVSETGSVSDTYSVGSLVTD
jgi:hypothetical protein